MGETRVEVVKEGGSGEGGGGEGGGEGES